MEPKKRKSTSVDRIVDELYENPKARRFEKLTIRKYLYDILDELLQKEKVSKGSNGRYIIGERQKHYIKSIFLRRHLHLSVSDVDEDELDALNAKAEGAVTLSESGKVIDMRGATPVDAGFNPEEPPSPHVNRIEELGGDEFATVEMQLLKAIDLKLDVIIRLLSGRRIDEKRFRTAYLEFLQLMETCPEPGPIYDSHQALDDIDGFWIPEPKEKGDANDPEASF